MVAPLGRPMRIRIRKRALRVDRILLIKILDVVKLAQLVMVSPEKSSLSPPTVHPTQWTSDLWGRSDETSRA